GSGKSTLLRIVAGLETLQAGTLSFDGQTLATPDNVPPPEARGFGLVFQDHALFPHMTVGDNVAFGLGDLAADERHARVAEELANAGLADLADRFPHTLSGGQQQRVALARALAARPRLMLLDEPFASVDSTLRRSLREDTRRALRARGVPAIVVTHDADEAMEMADRIAVIDRGQVVQYGGPHDIWSKPANRFVAELFCDTDAFEASVQGGQLVSAFGPLPAKGTAYTDGQYVVIARPEAIRLSAEPGGQGKVVDTRFLGHRHLVSVASGDAILRASLTEAPSFAVGDAVAVHFETEGLFVYNRE
ncbi:MAG: ABC transporter ATP-binding protein, partial [Pseudomonadota bacterium]